MGRYSRSNSRSRSRGRGGDQEQEGYRLHVADLGVDCSQKEIERAFREFGDFYEVWLARNPPCFAFVVYKQRSSAEKAIKELDGRVVDGSRVRVSWARPRTRGSKSSTLSRSSDTDSRCYQCGERGHFSRNCNGRGRNGSTRYDDRRRRRSRSRSNSRSRRSNRSRSRTPRNYRRNDDLASRQSNGQSSNGSDRRRSRSNDRYNRRSRSRSVDRNRSNRSNSRSNNRHRHQSRSVSRDNKRTRSSQEKNGEIDHNQADEINGKDISNEDNDLKMSHNDEHIVAEVGDAEDDGMQNNDINENHNEPSPEHENTNNSNDDDNERYDPTRSDAEDDGNVDADNVVDANCDED